MLGESFFQQAAQFLLHDNADTSAIWVRVAARAKKTCRYSFMVLRVQVVCFWRATLCDFVVEFGLWGGAAFGGLVSVGG